MDNDDILILSLQKGAGLVSQHTEVLALLEMLGFYGPHWLLNKCYIFLLEILTQKSAFVEEYACKGCVCVHACVYLIITILTGLSIFPHVFFLIENIND